MFIIIKTQFIYYLYLLDFYNTANEKINGGSVMSIMLAKYLIPKLRVCSKRICSLDISNHSLAAETARWTGQI